LRQIRSKETFKNKINSKIIIGYKL
jgi:hypothetical protein